MARPVANFCALLLPLPEPDPPVTCPEGVLILRAVPGITSARAVLSAASSLIRGLSLVDMTSRGLRRISVLHPGQRFGLSLQAACPFERLAEATGLRGTHGRPLGPRSWCSPTRRVALSPRETRKGKWVSGVGGNRNLEHGHPPADPKWQPVPKRAGSCNWDIALSFELPNQSQKCPASRHPI
jgi:hypothetical protein